MFDKREARRAVAAAGVGNALEFYDFVTFTFFAIQIGRTFFPSSSDYATLMASFATFGAGFLARPVGAWYLGRLSDRTGRKPVLMLSMVLMGLGTSMLVFTPGYATIGIAAPVLAIVARLVQGFALGGEVGAASSYMIEASAQHRRGWVISWQQASQQISGACGAAVGLMISLTMSAQDLQTFGWRIALGAGLVIVPFALVIRKSIPETHGDAARPVLSPPADASYIRTCVIGCILIASGTISTYAFNYQASYVQSKLNFPPSVALAGQVSGYVIGLIFSLGGGALSDRFGRKPFIVGKPIALRCDDHANTELATGLS
ncbi:MFS transporter [Novosphingobium sp. Gsoil 351]|uniref:MFS transporter n=1 Tax=Novosphingobium sp. Gsoil 351 TaxID=2675225 RepID=UPI0018A87C42|nr:MFS transporter [Novosphingobium sp. Gsoil 351]